MYYDLQNKRKTEIEFINKIIIKLGKKHNIKTPHNKKLLKNIMQ